MVHTVILVFAQGVSGINPPLSNWFQRFFLLLPLLLLLLSFYFCSFTTLHVRVAGSFQEMRCLWYWHHLSVRTPDGTRALSSFSAVGRTDGVICSAANRFADKAEKAAM